MAKFKEKVKLSENALSKLIVSEDKVSNGDEVIEETEETQVDQSFTLVKEEEADTEEQEVTESYEEVEFLELNGQTETVNGIQYVTIGKCNADDDDDDDQFIDEIIEECSVTDSDFVETIVSDVVNVTNSVKVCFYHHHLSDPVIQIPNNFSIKEIAI